MHVRIRSLLLLGLALIPITALAQVDLTGDWTGIRNGAVVAKCSIKQTADGRLEFIIHRQPEERSRGRFLNATTIEASDWSDQGTIAEGGNLIRWRQSQSEWRRTVTTSAVDLTGDWTGIRNGAVVAKCSIKQTADGRLEFIIHRQPEERSRGRFLNATTIEASDWGDQGTVAEGGNLIRWRQSQSEWRRTVTTSAVDLTGDWTGIRNGAVVAKCSIKQTADGRLEFIIHRQPEERSRGRFLNATTIEASDWSDQGTIAEGGNLIRWRQSQSEWRRTVTTSAVDLTGDWTGIRNGAVVAKCSIKQTADGRLEFIIHRQPEERSRGRFLNATTIEASDWSDQGTIAEGGNLIRWRQSQSEWRRTVTSGESTASIGLNGCWNQCGVQLYQEGERVYYSAAWKNAPGEWQAGWVIQRGEGWIRGQELYLQNVTWPSVFLKGKPGPKTEYRMRLSADGNVLEGYPLIDGQRGRNVTWTRDK